MSLSWKDEKPKRNGNFALYGDHVKLETDQDRSTTQPQRPVATESAPPEREIEPSGKKKCWLLRPIAWVALLISVYLMNGIINAFFLLGVRVVDWLSTLPTLAIVLLTLAFGSIVLSLLFYGAMYLPTLVMTLSNLIYPSKNGVRYYLVGIIQLFISVLGIILAVTGSGNDSVFWDCVASVYFAIVYIVMLCSVKATIEH